MRLSENELKFIFLACSLSHGVYDYENNQTDEAFKNEYGISIAASYSLTEKLNSKVLAELRKRRASKQLK